MELAFLSTAASSALVCIGYKVLSAVCKCNISILNSIYLKLSYYRKGLASFLQQVYFKV